mmetsp:Transcript_8886/g.13081  ORF Transcript_8886/g.13081 Transcript_8886/m.13081 type:complete len:206 (-) Transcript_8886:891-1508(-)
MNVRLATCNACVIFIFEQSCVTLFRCNLRNSSSHETSSEYRHVLNRLRRFTEIVFLQRRHALENTNQTLGLRGIRQLSKLFAFKFILFITAGMLQTVLNAIHYFVRTRIILSPAGVLVHHFFGLFENQIPSDGGIFQGPIHPRFLLLWNFERFIRQRKSGIDGNLLNALRRHDHIHKANLLRFLRSHFLPLQHHTQSFLQTDERV